MRKPTRDALAARLSRYDSVLEVGVGRRPDLAGALADRGVDVTATDVRERPVPEGVRFLRDDIVARSERPDPGARYRVDAIYALNLPPELHGSTLEVARRVGAACLFTTLGCDPPAVPARPETVRGETLYIARE